MKRVLAISTLALFLAGAVVPVIAQEKEKVSTEKKDEKKCGKDCTKSCCKKGAAKDSTKSK